MKLLIVRIAAATVAIGLTGGVSAPAALANPYCSAAGLCESSRGGFSFTLPTGWESADASRLSYGQALLLRQTLPTPLPGQPTATANDTSILLGRLDMSLFADAEPDNEKAAARLASDMGEFFMPFAGSRINNRTTKLQAGEMSGSASSFEVKFTDRTKPNGQIWAGVIGSPGQRNDSGSRWFVVCLGTSLDPVDREAAKALTESIRPTSLSPESETTTSAASPTPSARVSTSVVPDMGRDWFLANLLSIEVYGVRAGTSDRTDQTLVDIGLSACDAIGGRGDDVAELVADEMVKEGAVTTQYDADIFLAKAVTAFCNE